MAKLFDDWRSGGNFADDIFKFIFLEWKLLHFALILTGVFTQGSNQQYASIDSDNGLEPSRGQVITWTFVDQVYAD